MSSALVPTGGNKTVTASGTGEPLVASSTRATWLFVKAKLTNTNDVYFGDSGVDVSTSNQVILDAGESVTIALPPGSRLHIDLADFYIDVDTNGEGVDFLYLA